MQPSFSNECPTHHEESQCFCLDCGLVMCPPCSLSHKCPSMKKKHIEYINESLLNNFKFEKYLGKGSFGYVFKVQSLLDDQIYALKVIEEVDKTSFQLVRKEVAMMAKIKHQNIIKYHMSSWIEEKEILWIAMELCQGSLDKYLNNLDVKTAMEYFREICKGVQALHQEFQIIHRDLKPGNILIKDGIPKLCDFGEAREFKENITLTNKQGFGTYEYLAPEIFNIMEKSHPQYNEKTDIWALGIILYKMLTQNRHPFLQGLKSSGENMISIIRKILNETELEIDPSITDPDVRKILIGCLKKSPEKRFNIQEIMNYLKPSSTNQQELTKSWENSSWKLWKILDGQNFVEFVCFSPNGSKILSGSRDKTVKLWDFSSGILLKSFEGHSDFVWWVCYSMDESMIVSASKDSTIKIWDITSGKLLKTLKGHTKIVYSVEFSTDGLKIVSGSADKSIKLWEVSSGKLIKTFEVHSNKVLSVCFSRDGSLIASSSEDGSIKLVEVSSGKLMKTFLGHAGNVYVVRFSMDGSKIASCSKDKTIKIWDVPSEKLVRTLLGHSDEVNVISLSADGSKIVSGSQDETIKFWDVPSGKLLNTLENSSSVRAICLSPDCSRIAFGSCDKTIKLLQLE